MDQEASGSTPLFAVFLLSMFSLILIPYTLHAFFSDDEDEKDVVQTWSSKKDKKSTFLDTFIARLRKTFTPKMIAIWAFYLLLFWYVKTASAPMERFDPFDILQIPESATDADIKRAYRKLSLQYHPDKNPDPAAADYFAQYITKAYKALTDEVSRENFKKYGHPDGQQAVSISVALPEWFFNKDKEAAPAILLTLLLCGIVLPLGLAACYLGRSNRYVGPNEVHQETLQFYLYSPYAVKKFQGVAKLPETLICAMEFLPPHFNISQEQMPALQNLSRELSSFYPELRDKNGPFFKKRHPCLVKAHMLLYAQTARIAVDPILKKDLEYLLQRAPRLMQEMFTISSIPRIAPGYGWLQPAMGTVELMQCLIQAVPLEEKKKCPVTVSRGSDGTAALLQLPHFDEDLVKKLSKRKIKTLADFQALSKEERKMNLQSCSVGLQHVEDVETMLSALPTPFVTARLLIEDPESGKVDPDAIALAEESVMTCSVRAMLLRPSHQSARFDPESIKGKAAMAYAPNFPFPRTENWFFLLGDASNGTLLAFNRVSLLEAEAVGARYASNWKNGATLLGGDDSMSEEALIENLGQKVELKFRAPPAGKHDLCLYVMPDSWVGIDRALPLKLKTVEPTRAEREGRAAAPRAGGGGSKAAVKNRNLDRSEESEQFMATGSVGEEEENSDAGDYIADSDYDDREDDEEEDEEESDVDYDSDEYGTEESGDEDEEDVDGDEPPPLVASS